MNHRENLLSLLSRRGFSFIPPSFGLTPHLIDVYKKRTQSSLPYEDFFDMPWKNVPLIKIPDNTQSFLSWYPSPPREGTHFDWWGVAYEPGSADAMHMTHMLHPLQGITDFERIKEYPFPLGDDIGMQSSMMSPELYRTWLKPLLKKVIDAVKSHNPKIIIMYHSCGYVLPFIEDLIEVGVDVLNPIQPESMDYREITAAYGDRLSFHGCIGTQSVMPFGTPSEVKAAVKECLDAMGPRGGMLPSPTHVLEPEVPWENIITYVEACREYSR
jgi:hypothetical protein